ncbi:ATP-dependent RNA helicase DeaD [Thermosulfidibacter takaii ABI70S6]|uniref:ATP-dependent RNA helicase DeaD n=1 Tax=Thermosulfidibacter takaii (strain DSM 17441 / JCM 13301 / NBRC 103674 / ABI70S6) TaxID=1298851 RepID=A0A0S3QVA1_THET7|nr:DEAD/DEAH box helicase [Thermosulfidibacter takaii]BAT72251.1 ATP-dependent RNA helicase DeaD [Thermosulfidibacter takaii ABI70S6]
MIFEKLGRNVRKALSSMGYEKPTPVQERVIPLALEGKDVVAVADTGTGKTAAFGIPIVQMLSRRFREVKALILVPTRELASQVADEIWKLGRFKGIRVAAMYGGKPVRRDISLLKRGSLQVVVGTPGRIADLIERGALWLSSIKFLVLDEVDRMLDMGFEEDINYIIESCSEERQTMFFSATLPEGIRSMMSDYLRDDFELIEVESRELKPKIEHRLFGTHRDRFGTLLGVLQRFENGGNAIIFVNRKVEAQELAEKLQQAGISKVACLHGDMSQRKREAVMAAFRKGRVKTLVATDVAARGIDVRSVELVINYRLPEDPDMYTHRAGRTARAGSSGLAVSLVSRRDFVPLKRIDALRRVRIEHLN